MRIAFVAPDPSEFISGGNIYNRNLIEALVARGCSVELMSTLPAADEKYDCTILDSIYFNLIEKAPAPPNTFALVHHLGSLYPMSADRFETEDRPLLDKCDNYVVTSPFMQEFLTRKGYALDSITMVEPVAPPLAKSNRAPVTKVKAVMLNNLVERKGVLDFLTQLAKAEVPPYYTLRIIGSPDAEPEYSAACHELVRSNANLSKTVSFLGSQDDAGVKSVMQKSNLFISASKMETFGMSIQEASLQGLPLLVCEGGYSGRHVIPGENGWRVNGTEEAVKVFARLTAQPGELSVMAERAFVTESIYATSCDKSAESLVRFLARKIQSN